MREVASSTVPASSLRYYYELPIRTMIVGVKGDFKRKI